MYNLFARCRVRLFLLAALTVLLPASGVPAQELVAPQPLADVSAPPTDQITVELVQSRKKQLEAAEALDPALKERATGLYQQALDELRKADESARRVAQWKEIREGAPRTVGELKAELARPEEAVEVDIPAAATIVELEQLVAQARQALSDSDATLAKLKEEAARRTERRAQIGQLELDAKKRLADIEKALGAPPARGDPPELVLVQQTLHQASKLAAERELAMLAEERPTYDITDELLTRQQEVAARDAVRAQGKFELLQEAGERLRQRDASTQAQWAKQAADQAPAALKHLAEENVQLAQRRVGPKGLTTKIKTASEAKGAAEQELKRLLERRTDIEQKLNLPGMSPFLGPLLLQERSELPEIRELGQRVYTRHKEIAATRLQMAEVKRHALELEDVEDELQTLVAGLAPSTRAAESLELEEQARSFLESRHRLLTDLGTGYTSYFKQLNDLNAVEQQLIDETDEVLDLIDRRLIWLRSSAPLSVDDFRSCGSAAVYLADLGRWIQVLADLWRTPTRRPLGILLVIVVALLLLAGRGPAQRRLQQLGDAAARSYLTPYSTTIQALALTILLSLVWPGVLFCVGLCLRSDLEAAAFSQLVGASLIAAAVVYLPIEFVRRLCSDDGLAESHFRWAEYRVRSVRRHLRWLVSAGLLLVFLFDIVTQGGTEPWRDSFGRLLFILAMVLMALFMQRTLRSSRPRAVNVPPRKRSLAAKAVYRSAVAGPLVLATLAALGYYFTAMDLSDRLFESIWLGLGLVVFHGMALRWLRLVRGHRAVEQARERRRAEMAKAEQETGVTEAIEEGEETPDSLLDDAGEPELDLETINLHTRRLLQVCLAFAVLVGLRFIWLDALPTLGILDRVVSSTPYQVTKTVPGPDGNPVLQTSTEFRLVTIMDVLFAVLVLVVALVAARNIPGLIEVGLPQNVPLDAGARYALSTLIQYTVAAVGLVVASAMMGIGWSKVQWLIAALSVGIGFGLQELVANFISGIILLFERPVRVGDTVTVDNVTGVVTRVRIRATTIRNWDRQEYLIPNKDLITGRVINWTLSDNLNRVVIKIGVGYGSDTERARALLLKILDEHPVVMKDPPPSVTFEGFGDSALDIVVRAILPNMACRLSATHQLHTTIHQQFAAAGIEIAFPQTDIHVRSMPDGHADLKPSHAEPA